MVIITIYDSTRAVLSETKLSTALVGAKTVSELIRLYESEGWKVIRRSLFRVSLTRGFDRRFITMKDVS